MLGLMLGCMLVVVAVFAATNVATIATTKDRIVEPQAAVGFDADAIVVLGASVFADGTPSGILRDRLDDGIALYKEGVAPNTCFARYMLSYVEKPAWSQKMS